MSALGGDYLLLVWVGISILSSGIAVCHALTRFRGIELIGYGAGAGVVIHAFLGLIMALLPQLRPAVIWIFLFLPIGPLIYIWRRGMWSELLVQLQRETKWSLAIWLLFVVLCVAITHLAVNFPATLPDGRYVFKRQTLNVKIQYMTSLPCDNYIPYIVTEYLLRNISFREERPLLPNNEVSNRTILMSLVALPFRAALGVAEAPKPLGKFSYVGQDWPDVEKLNENGYFQQFLVVGIFLNSLLLIGLLVLFSNSGAHKILVTGALLYLTNPYLISETIFTWPKALAGFFILLAWHSLRTRRDPRLTALCIGLAYNCHPYAVVFVAPLALVHLRRWWQSVARPRALAEFAAVFILSILPWLLWTRLYLGIPSNLISQNLIPLVSHVSIVDLVWIRLKNMVELLNPRFLEIYPFNAALIFDNYVTCLPGAVGLLIILPAFLKLARQSANLRWQIILPAILIPLVFSVPALPVLLGYQPIVGTLLFLGLVHLSDTVSLRTFRVLVASQFLCNIGLIALQGWVVSAHLA